jgi:hypothetical protein
MQELRMERDSLRQKKGALSDVGMNNIENVGILKSES